MNTNSCTAQTTEGPMQDYTSATVVSTAANYIMDREDTFTHTYRTYIKLRENGRINLRFWGGKSI
ncbi:hypothetical protein D3C73_712860 [compost metagenome]